ncbi:MAG TPA: amidase family protein, partial [Caulobacteraceae bacterium]|nr:amidase family protein [Caulobacteraceae bacterium]
MRFSRRAFLVGAAAAPLSACATGQLSGLPRDLAWLDGVGTADLIRKREITAAEAVSTAIERARTLNPRLNFLVAVDFERAAATAADPLPAAPFAGVPILIKDLNDVGGLPTRWGSRATEGVPPARETEATAAAVLAAGFTAIGKSATPEYGFLPTTEPLAFGPTRNPWAPARSAGGSSGGAAAAVAAGVIPVGHASDGGGSIRIPASCCGLFGLKPSRARVIGDRNGPTELGVELAVTRSVRDSAALLASVERGGAGASYPKVGLVTDPLNRKLRIGFITVDPLGQPAEPDVRDGVAATARLLAGLGHEVEETRWAMAGATLTEDFLNLWSEGAARAIAATARHMPRARAEEAMEPFTLGLYRRRTALSDHEFEASVKRLIETCNAHLAWYQRYDVVLSPVLASAPPPIGYLAPDVPFDTL